MVDLAVPETWQVISRRQATLHQDGEDYWIFDGDGKTPSSYEYNIDVTELESNEVKIFLQKWLEVLYLQYKRTNNLNDEQQDRHTF